MDSNMKKSYTLFAPITKVDKEQQIVAGYASTEKRDLQGEIIKLDAIEQALPGWMEYKNIREMHQNWAVGVAKSAKVDGKGLYIEAKIVDKDAWAKCVDQVYSAFSIGGRVTERDEDDPTIIKGLELTEISLVDRPANPEARFDLVKSAHLLDDSIVKIAPITPEVIENKVEEIVEKAVAKVEEVVPVIVKDVVPVVEETIEKAEEIVGSDDLAFGLLNQLYKSKGVDGDTLETLGVEALKSVLLSTLDIISKSKLSGANKDALQAIHDHASRMGADCAAKGLKAGDIAKMASKVEKAETALTESEEKVSSLNNRIKELEAMPEVPKGKLRVVSKGEDVGQDIDEGEEALLKSMSEEARTRYLIKNIHKSGGMPLNKRQ